MGYLHGFTIFTLKMKKILLFGMCMLMLLVPLVSGAITDDVQAWYLMDGVDSTFDVNGATGITGKIGGGFDFENGEGDYLNGFQNDIDSITNTISISFWMNKESVITDKKTFSFGTSASYQSIGMLMDRGGTDGRLRFAMFSELVIDNVDTSFKNDGWHHVVGTVDGTTKNWSIYVDGVLEASAIATNALNLGNTTHISEMMLVLVMLTE